MTQKQNGNQSQSNQSNSNQSQRDDAQAQKFAERAQQPAKAIDEDAAASRAGGEQINPDDAQDTVDHMKEMVDSGRIDNDAFAGERNDDDEESDLGILDDAEDDAPLSEKGGADTGNSG